MLLERLIADLEISLEAFAMCEVAPGWRLRLGRLGWVTVHFVLAGRGRLRAGEREVVALEPRSLVIVPADRPHAIEAGAHVEHEAVADERGPRADGLVVLGAGPRTDDELSIACGRLQARTAGGLGLFDGLDRPLVIDFGDSPEMGAIFERLLAEQRGHSTGSTLMMRNLMSEAMILMFRRLCGDPDCPLPWLAALEDPRLSAAIALMLEHPERPHSLESLAAASLMSRTAFATTFSRRFGLPPMTYLRDVRMRRAATLLRGTDLTIEQVAAGVGYASRSRFSRAFTGRFGISPGAFRRARGEPLVPR